MFRILGMVLNVLGLNLIFTPIILILKWIPLIGVLLSGVGSLAAFFFSLIVGLTMSLLVIALAWLFFRPLVGLTLLTLTCLSTYLIFYWDKVMMMAAS